MSCWSRSLIILWLYVPVHIDDPNIGESLCLQMHVHLMIPEHQVDMIFFNVLVGVKVWSMLVQSCCNYFGPGCAEYTENLTHILIIRCLEFTTLFCSRFHYSSAVFLVANGMRHCLGTRLNTKLWYFPWIVVYLSWVDGLVLISNQKNLPDLLMTQVPDSIMQSVSHRMPTVMPKLVS